MKQSWGNILFIASDVIIGAYLLFAFSSFDSKGMNKVACNKVNIDIADNATNGFIDAKIIKDRLQKGGIYPMGKPLDLVNTRRIEEALAKSPFVKTAECYKTEGGHVYISVTQRMPVIRIKAANGDDYYVDDNDCVMPTTRYTSDLIIATGNIDRWYATNFISPLGKIIMANELWKNLIEQVNVLPNHSIELVPRIGDHIVHIGRLPDGKGRVDHLNAIKDFMTRKMTRLEKFYRYGLSEVGWNKYSYIDIEFDNQIICRKRDTHAVSLATETDMPRHDESATAPADAEVEKKKDDAAGNKKESPNEKKSDGDAKERKSDAKERKLDDNAKVKKSDGNAKDTKSGDRSRKNQSSNSR